MSNPTFTITVMAGFDGGRIVYESVVDDYGAHDSRLVFGGNADEASRYVADRITRLTAENVVPKGEPLQIEAPVKVRVRKAKEPLVDPLAALDALETVDLSEAG